MKLVAAAALALLLGAGCGSSPSKDDPPAKSLATRGFEEAARQLAEVVGTLHFRGWEPHVTLTGEPPRPHVRLGTIRNESRVVLDLLDLRAELTRRLVADGKVFVAPDRADPARAEPVDPSAPRVSFVITGSVHDDVHTKDGQRTHALTIELRVIDLHDMSVEQQVHAYSGEVLED